MGLYENKAYENKGGSGSLARHEAAQIALQRKAPLSLVPLAVLDEAAGLKQFGRRADWVRMSRRLGEMLPGVRSKLDAALAHAGQGGSWGQLRAEAHKTKGMAGNVGALEMQAAAARLQGELDSAMAEAVADSGAAAPAAHAAAHGAAVGAARVATAYESLKMAFGAFEGALVGLGPSASAGGGKKVALADASITHHYSR